MTETSMHIDQVTTPAGGVIGMCHCPGRQGVDGDGRVWARQLDQDIQTLKNWGTCAVITLLQRHEIEKLGVRDLDKAVLADGLRWYHLPIADMAAPAQEFKEAFVAFGSEIFECLESNADKPGKIVLHCAAGLGRTGTIAASLLVHYGVAPQVAISRVRSARPGAIETRVQEQFVRDATILNYAVASRD